MTFDEYFDENFVECDNDPACYSKIPSLTDKLGYRCDLIDKDDLKDLWDAAVASTKGE